MAEPFTPFVTGAAFAGIKMLETGFELSAVGERTAELLKITELVESELHTAQRLRRLKDPFLSPEERERMDRIIDSTEDAIRAVAQLIEPSRVDRETRNGKIGLGNRFAWVFRDSHKIQERYARLTLSNQLLTSIIATLEMRIPPRPADHALGLDDGGPGNGTRTPPGAPPPSYEMSEMLEWRRSKRSTVNTGRNNVGHYRGPDVNNNNNNSERQPEMRNFASAT